MNIPKATKPAADRPAHGLRGIDDHLGRSIDTEASNGTQRTFPPAEKLAVLADARTRLVASGDMDLHSAVDSLQEEAERTGLVDEIGQDGAQVIIAEPFRADRKLETLGPPLSVDELADAIGEAWDSADQIPPPSGPEDFGLPPIEERDLVPFQRPPLTLSEWRERDLPEPDFLMGSWMTTTTRALLAADTGLGKTNFAMALSMHIAAGAPFLHWQRRRPARVLYIDGEMARRLFRQRIVEAERRLNLPIEGFHALSREDFELEPLNTVRGQQQIESVIAAIGGVDFIAFDSLMCLIAGDLKDGAPWQATIPWVRSLTKRSIGQLWINHTGHNADRSYGDKTKEWQLDTVGHMEANARSDTDISFNLEFRKARERTPATREDFERVGIALVGDEWVSDRINAQKPGHVSPVCLKFLDALNNALAGDQVSKVQGRRAVSDDLWRAECVGRGLIDPKGKPDSARSLFAKHKRDLVGANRIGCHDGLTWIL